MNEPGWLRVELFLFVLPALMALSFAVVSVTIISDLILKAFFFVFYCIVAGVYAYAVKRKRRQLQNLKEEQGSSLRQKDLK